MEVPFNWEALTKDAVGQNLIPDDIFVSRSKIPGKVEFDAIKTSGDGNCLYRSVSLILVGNKILHLLLRLLTAIELFLHASYYASHPKFLSGMKSPSADVPEDIMFTLCLSDTGMTMWESTKCGEDAIKREAATDCRVPKWSVMVHLMALTNVIGRSIFQHFPKIAQKQGHFSMMKSSPGNVLSMLIQQLYFGQGMGALTLTQWVGISLITSFLLSNAGHAQPIQKRVCHCQITRNFTRMK